MNLFDTTQLGLQRAIAGAGMRQATIADNIANANTPGYQRKDVDFHATLRAALEAGDPSAAVSSATFAPATDRSEGAMRFDGNGVDIDRESSTMAANALEYETLVSVARGRTDVLRSAMGVG
jgi:flagellar basal-body rod protein FlgB